MRATLNCVGLFVGVVCARPFERKPMHKSVQRDMELIIFFILVFRCFYSHSMVAGGLELIS